MTQIPFQAFTVRANGKTPRLITEVEIFPPHALNATSPTVPVAASMQGRKYQGLYDTGATNSAISPQVVADFQLASIGARTVGVGGGSLATTAHLVNIALPNRVMFQIVPVAKMVLLGGIDVLIGMDVLGMGDFAVTHQDGKTVFSFCVPARKHIDFVKDVTTIPRASRNSPCPCNSGKKYKACHGRHF
jgi:predicted aspartyl protease